jgi:CubicO group peptidase (beta-lactamase class C family)
MRWMTPRVVLVRLGAALLLLGPHAVLAERPLPPQSPRQDAVGADAASSVPNDLDAYIGRVLETFNVPGLSIAIVRNGQTVLTRGYGVRRMGEPARVDERTLFGIGSNTKLFTALALGLLVEDGKVAWDLPVITYLPWFRLSNPYVTQEITVRDLLVHRSGLGLGAGDLLLFPESTYTRNELVRRLRSVPLATSFRSTYAYDNVLYLAAAEVIEAVSGLSWEDFVRTRILRRVGMDDSTVRHADAAGRANLSATHAEVEGKLRLVRPLADDKINPAGGIDSSAQDMARWMNVFVSGGKLADGSRLFSERTFRELTTPVTLIPIGGGRAAELAALTPQFRAYALGLVVEDYRGHKVFLHTGGMPGYVSKVLWMPDVGLGVTVLTNQESGSAFDAVVYRVVDHVLGAPATDWVDAFRRVLERQRAATAGTLAKAASTRATDSRPSLSLRGYAGTYVDAWYGDITIEEAGAGLVMRFSKTPSLVGDLEHWQHDTFIVRWRDRELRADAYVTFALNPDGTIDQAKMRAVSPATDFSFDFQDLLLKRR